MKKIMCILWLPILLTQTVLAAAISIQGIVKNSAGIGIADAAVRLAINKRSDTTDAQGAFAIIGATGALRAEALTKPPFRVFLAGNSVIIAPVFENTRGSVAVFSSAGRETACIPFHGTRAGKQIVSIPELVSGLNIVRVTMGQETITQTLVCPGNATTYMKSNGANARASEHFYLTKLADVAIVDTLIATKAGFNDARVPLDSYNKQNVAMVLDSLDGAMPFVYDKENTGADCAAPTNFPAFNALTAVSNLPDPFLMADGKTRITTKAQWRCRRAEISALMQYWVSGPKGAPPGSLTATYSGNKLTVVVTQGSASITLSSTITAPSGAGPFPLVIGMNTATGSLPSGIFSSVAKMTFTSSQMGISDPMNVTRGAGTYFTMYPDKNAAAMIEWAWGVSRIIDGLYKTADQNKIDLKHIAVTGCSYQGKMSLYAGAFDERIALVLPEESGGGGEASWRFMATQTGTEDLEAAQGTAWYAQNLKQFRNADAPKLPVDMHELVAMVAPRAILAIENTGIDRLGSQAGSVSMKAAAEVYKALGIPDRIGFTQAQAPGHCSFPGSQTADVQAFVDKFLLGKTANTAIAKCSYTTDMTKWITWTTPELK
jgi:hypothetical protein